ncbi:Endothelin-converting enzyme 1 [Clostridium sp. DL-VIII]|uniref:M13 family metallopeptidase n=1 Tax=Clostridium sp. DL-VIII TaxID=641107 RepID=UPI00023AF68C|nr:M13 family metallopeptidase [Clostridium sp. DL-VIII]EHI97388.1 Endothelin-converting enzyme 1 [Clostridium sp. DL-VIII]
MRKNVLKKISAIIVFILCISMSLNNTAYSFEFKAIGVANKSNVERSKDIRVQDDFYNAVNKEWLLSTKLQDGYISYGTFEEVCGKVNDDMLTIILDIQKNKDKYNKNDDEIKALNLYNNYLNIQKRNELGVKPIKKYINMVNEIESIEKLKDILGNNEFSYFQPLINLGVGPDYKDSNTNVLYVSRSNLGLGNSFYYKDNSENGKKIKDAYINYLTKLHTLYGESEEEAKNSAQTFYNMEKNVAQMIPSYEEDAKDEDRVLKSYNVYTVKELDKLVPNINFSKLLSNLNINKANKVIVENPEELRLVNSFITEKNIENMKRYLKTSILLNTDSLLTMQHREACDELRRIFYGVEPTDLNEGCGVKFVSCQLNEIISKLYVNKYFDKESKDDVENMSKEIIKNFEKRLKNNTWMSKATKKKALSKLEHVNVKIGYPEEWNDYSDVEVKSYDEGGSLVDNVMNIYMSQSKRQFSKLDKPVNKSEWNMGACAVNAYYNALNNEIVFPAGILQSPFYDKNASKEKNLGGIGAVIGHELTHAFDNTGAQFDENGKLKNWWNENDYEEFISRSKKIVDYYSNIEINDGKHVNGFLTVGENISDLGGIACVLDIAKKTENPDLKALFENYATIWREVSTKELKEYLLNNDSHAPKKVRVNVVLSQFEDFYKTYNIKEGDEMYVKPEERVGIW